MRTPRHCRQRDLKEAAGAAAGYGAGIGIGGRGGVRFCNVLRS
jgi:hypothetical protein